MALKARSHKFMTPCPPGRRRTYNHVSPAMKGAYPILTVEDDLNDVFLVEHAFRSTSMPNPLYFVHDGQEAIDYLNGAGRFADRTKYLFPGLVLLDLKLPLRS